MTTTYDWRGGNGAFNSAAKWSPRGVPGASDNADFANGGTVNGDGGGVFEIATLSVEAKVTFASVNGSYAPTVDATNGLDVSGGKLTLDDGSSLGVNLTGMYTSQPPASANIDNSGTVIVSASQLNVSAGGMNIGYSAAGALTVTKSGSVTTTSGNVDYAGLSLGISDSGSGTLTVTDDGTLTVMDSGANFGYSGTAKVVVSAGGTIALAGQSGDDAALGLAATSGSSATLSIAGAGSTVSIATGPVNDGFGGTASITVGAGGTFDVTTAQIGILLGVQSTGAGTLTINGGLLTDVGELQIGQSGTGKYLQEAKGSATIGADVNPTVAPAISLGVDAGGAGTGTVTGSGTDLTIDGQLDIGLAGTGHFTVSSGAQVMSGDTSGTTTAGVALGLYADSAGTLTVTGSGSRLGNTGLFVIGSHGDAHVTVSSSAALATTLAASFGVDGVAIGSGSDSTGTLTLTTHGAFGDALDMVVGGSGSGDVSIASAATLSVGNSLTLSSQPVALFLGQSAGAVGKLTLGGTGSVLSVHGELADGASGKGTLTISAGGHATTGDASGATDAGLLVGDTAGSVGALTVTGAAASLVNTGLFDIGDGGAGTLTVSAGGSISTSIAAALMQDGADLGVVAGGSGTAKVTGAGSRWSVGSNLVIGGHGTGLVTIADSASVTIGSSLVLGQGSDGVGRATIESGGLLSATGNVTLGLGSGAIGAVTVEGTGSAFDYGAQLAIGGAGTATLAIDAGGIVQAASGGSGVIDVAPASGGKATVTVAGKFAGTSISIGQAGTATVGTAKLTIDAGGTLAVSGAAMVEHDATVALAGGLLQAGSLSFLDGGKLSGYGSIAGSVGAAAITASGGTLAINGAIGAVGSIAGTLKVDAGATLNLLGSVAAHVHLDFDGSGAVLDLADPNMMAGIIADFAAGNTIDLGGVTATGFAYNGTTTAGHLTIDQSGGGNVVLAFSGNYSQTSFVVSNVAGGVVITHG